MASTDFTSMPQNLTDGFRDKSVPDPILTARQYPTFLPLWCLFMKKGPVGRVLADPATAEQLFGTESFDPSSKFFNHATLYRNTLAPTGQAIYQRLQPADAKVALMRIWLDVLPMAIPQYQRGTDGKYLLDQAGNPQPTGTTLPGFTVKLVKTAIGASTGGEFGQASQMVGNQTNPVDATQSQRYPLFDIPVSSFGSYGNDLGFRMWAPVAGSRVLPDAELLTVNKAYPYVFACLDRSSDTIQNIQTISGVQEVTAVLKPNQYKASVGNQAISFDPRFFEQYNDRERVGIAPLYGPFEQVHVYHDNIETLLKLFYDAEESMIDQFSDFTGEGYTADDVGEIHLFNFIGGRSSKNVPYHTYLIDRTASDAEAFSDISAVWAEGGSDGDTSLDSFNTLVGNEISKYGDINNEVTEDRLGNPETDFFDSGYDTETKMKLASFIAVRKDTFLHWSLMDNQQTQTLTADQESSLAIALYTRGQMLPESTEFGTPAARFLIAGCDGKLIGSSYPKRLPLGLEIAFKSGQYMGAGNGQWNSAMSFSNGSRANVTMFRDVNVTWRPIAARQRDWANGLIYVQKKNTDQLFFPAIRTGYSVAQSIATSYFNVRIMMDLQKVADRVWAEFSGADQYSNEQFKKYVEAEFLRQTEGKYDKRGVVRGYVSFRAVDEFNGYSWTLNIDFGGDNMKTVQYTLLTGYRRESMPAVN